MPPDSLRDSISTVLPGPWAVAVSGGADSVALLRLLCNRPDLSLHVVHLDHQTRSGESTLDAAFVADLAAGLSLPATIARRSDIEAKMSRFPTNRSARFRAARMELFRQTVASFALTGVITAHHLDDQAETIFQRLLRGAGPTALAGMSPRAVVGGLTILRPLLAIPSVQLRQYLTDLSQPWREDSSNTSPHYLRNRLRPILADDPQLRNSLIDLGNACRHWRSWLNENTPRLPETFAVDKLASLPSPLARHAAGKWLLQRGVPMNQLSRSICDRLTEMATDAATSPRQMFPGAIIVRRRAGKIFADTCRGHLRPPTQQ